jgi:hypothetical protein
MCGMILLLSFLLHFTSPFLIHLARWKRYQAAKSHEVITFEEFAIIDDEDKFSDAQWQVW